LTDQQSLDQVKPSSGRRWLVAGVVVALLVAMAAQVGQSSTALSHLHRGSLSVIAVTVLLQFLSQLAFNEAVLLPLRPYSAGLGYWEFYMVRTGGFFIGNVVPVAGNIAVRLTYLRRRGVTYLEFTWATLLSNVVALVAAAALAVAATALLWSATGKPSNAVVALAAGTLAISLIAFLTFRLLPRIARHPRLQRWRWVADMSGFEASHPTIAAVFALSLIRHVLNFVTFGLLYQSLSNSPGGFLTGGLVYALTTPARMVNFTPGNLGVIEWVVALVGKALTFEVATGLIVALVFRAVAPLGQALGVPFGWAWLALARKR
jgi:uncharacterized membrane protein YbhN (UPF0104 family)